jgi:hypothetical protein
MENRFWTTLGLLILLSVVFLAGCATGTSYQSPETEYSSTSSVPSSYYNYNPQYQHWFTAPEWMPEVGP